ncbi:MAG: YciC family protein [Bacteroidota bacterium]
MVTILNNQQYDFHPDAGNAYSIGWKVIWVYFVELLVVSIVYAVLSGPIGFLQWNIDHFEWFIVPLAMFAIAYGIFVAGPISYGVKWVFLKAVRGERIEIRDIFMVFQRNYWNVVIANIVVGVIVGLGIVMLIVPGIIFACRLAFVPYLVVDKEMDVMDALRVSWDMTRGYGWQIFFMGFLAIWVVIAGLICLFVGVFISAMWISTAFATMYHAVELKNGIPEIRYTGE